MYYDICTYKRGRKTYRRELLRESFRVKGKVVKRTLANLTDWPENIRAAVRRALAEKRDGSHGAGLAGLIGGQAGVHLRQGKSVGALWLLHEQAEAAGLAMALGDSRDGRLALW